MILIQDGYMIDPKSGKEGNFDILIDGDKIVKIAEKIEPKGKVTRINAEGLLVAPGLVDVHVHFRDPGFTAKEDINTGAAAAAKGGVTTVVLMANTKPTVDSMVLMKKLSSKKMNRVKKKHIRSLAMPVSFMMPCRMQLT